MIDSHSHLYLPEFDADRVEVMDRARHAGVTHIILPNVDLTTIEPMRAMHAAYPAITSMAMGLHPTEVNDSSDDLLSVITDNLLTHRGDYIAVGEIGLDLYWDKTFRDKQMRVFEEQCRLAMKESLPVIIHCREAMEEMLEVLEGLKGLTGVMHSFPGTADDVDRVRVRGDFYFGVNGIATFKNSRMDSTIRAITPERLLLETDAPYLAPVPHRGKRNESAFIVATLAKSAEVLQMTAGELDRITTDNARRLFSL